MDGLREVIADVQLLGEKIDNCRLAVEILEFQEDKSIEDELVENIKQLTKDLDNLEEDVVLSEKYDSYPAVVTIHPGAGGTESHDWAEMLFRM